MLRTERNCINVAINTSENKEWEACRCYVDTRHTFEGNPYDKVWQTIGKAGLELRGECRWMTGTNPPWLDLIVRKGSEFPLKWLVGNTGVSKASKMIFTYLFKNCKIPASYFLFQKSIGYLYWPDHENLARAGKKNSVLLALKWFLSSAQKGKEWAWPHIAAFHGSSLNFWLCNFPIARWLCMAGWFRGHCLFWNEPLECTNGILCH